MQLGSQLHPRGTANDDYPMRIFCLCGKDHGLAWALCIVMAFGTDYFRSVQQPAIARGTYNGVSVPLYVDGTEVRSGTPSLLTGFGYDLDHCDLHLGAYRSPECDFGLLGEVDEVQLCGSLSARRRSASSPLRGIKPRQGRPSGNTE
jgi:hypothetical protein